MLRWMTRLTLTQLIERAKRVEFPSFNSRVWCFACMSTGNMSHDNIWTHQPMFVKLGKRVHTFTLHILCSIYIYIYIYIYFVCLRLILAPKKEEERRNGRVKFWKNSRTRVVHQIKQQHQNIDLGTLLKISKLLTPRPKNWIKYLKKF